MKVPPWLALSDKFLKIYTSRCSIHSLIQFVLRLLCQTFPKLLTFTLRDNLLHWWFCKIHILKKLYGYKLVRALKQSGMKRSSKWCRRNHTTQYKYLPRLITGSWSVKKSRKKIEHLHNMLHILMNENTWGQFLLSFWHLLFHFFFHFLFFQHFCLLSYFKIIKCTAKLLITIFIECQLKKDNLKSVFGCQSLGAQIGIPVSKRPGYVTV